MKNYLKHDEWKIIEEGFHPEYNRITESLCSIGNGRMGQRANFEEQYSGDSMLGNYVAGVYYPDKTRVGWWKNGYPEYFAKVINAVNWIGINISIDDETLDLANCKIESFNRILNMQEGFLARTFIANLPTGKKIKIDAKRFLSIVDDESGAIQYSITPLNFSAKLTITPYLDFDVKNEDSNYDEKFWQEVNKDIKDNAGFITAKTIKPQCYAKDYEGFYVCSAMQFDVVINDKKLALEYKSEQKEKYVASSITIDSKENETITIYKYATIVSSENHAKENLEQTCKKILSSVYTKGFATMLAEQKQAWTQKWQESDIEITGDVSAQQGIRFNIFQLNQTYTGEDARLNIGPKGFTGEKYGGSTYWDTEAYCLAFYLSTAKPSVAKNLLLYRYNHLPRAIENATKLGFTNGAALYPMVTMNGEECHNEWEITFEEIHRNGAIARAIYDYIRYTDDKDYLIDYGLEVLIAIARFWSQRITWSETKNKYVMLSVTGPNEYENNVNNNWYTNTLACWCIAYALEATAYVKTNDLTKYQTLITKINFNETKETAKYQDIIAKMYFPINEELGIYMQQDDYMDKEQVLAKDLDPTIRPLCQHWSWDRILRSCFIKQADTLQGIYLFENDFDMVTVKKHFDFYEPRTVHESSLSPCIHSILAAKLGYKEKAYEMYLRTARLDLDDYNNDTEDGCHTTSMAGTWMSVVQGFGGMRVRDGKIHFSPFVPKEWQSLAFKVLFRGILLKIKTDKDQVIIENQANESISLFVFEKEFTIKGKSKKTIITKNRS
jgi:maltose phosphorylase